MNNPNLDMLKKSIEYNELVNIFYNFIKKDNYFNNILL